MGIEGKCVEVWGGDVGRGIRGGGPTKHRKELQGTTRNYKVLLNLQNA